MGRPRTLKPTPTGRQILDVILPRYGSISAAARAAGVAEPTLRRKIYEGDASRVDLPTTAKLVAIGIPKRLLAS